MESNLVIEKELSQIAQFVKDQKGNTSQLTVPTDAVGIGTSNPLTKLYIVHTASADANNGQLGIATPNGNLLLLGRADSYGFVQSHNREPLALNPIGNNVGIGTTNPKAGLHVSGEGNAGIVWIERSGKSLVLNPNYGGKNKFAHIATYEGSNMGLKLDVNEQTGLTITIGGNVGIGTTSPQEKLDVDGNINVTGDIKLSGADCAEYFDVEDSHPLSPGTVMVIGDENKLHQCTEAYDKKVAGVLSGAGNCKPGIVLNRQQSQNNRMPVALTGKVFCKVDAQYSPIAIGDLLTTSPTPGHAMKADQPLKAFGAVIGKALRPFAEGQGLVPILIALQ